MNASPTAEELTNNWTDSGFLEKKIWPAKDTVCALEDDAAFHHLSHDASH